MLGSSFLLVWSSLAGLKLVFKCLCFHHFIHFIKPADIFTLVTIREEHLQLLIKVMAACSPFLSRNHLRVDGQVSSIYRKRLTSHYLRVTLLAADFLINKNEIHQQTNKQLLTQSWLLVFLSDAPSTCCAYVNILQKGIAGKKNNARALCVYLHFYVWVRMCTVFWILCLRKSTFSSLSFFMVSNRFISVAYFKMFDSF